MGHFLRQLVRLVILREMKKVTAGGWGGGELGFGVWGIGFMRGWSMVLQKKSRKSNSTATCVVMDEGVR